MMTATPYGNERLARLLRLLRPAPEGWVARAKHIFSDQGARLAPAGVGTALTDGDLRELRQALENDPSFRERFDVDPVAATEAAGMRDLASAIDHEMRELVALAQRVARDDAYRSALESDPVGMVGAAGLPEVTAGQLVDALGEADGARTQPEVVAHGQEQLSPRAWLVLLLLGSAGLVERLRAAARGA